MTEQEIETVATHIGQELLESRTISVNDFEYVVGIIENHLQDYAA